MELNLKLQSVQQELSMKMRNVETAGLTPSEVKEHVKLPDYFLLSYFLNLNKCGASEMHPCFHSRALTSCFLLLSVFNLS